MSGHSLYLQARNHAVHVFPHGGADVPTADVPTSPCACIGHSMGRAGLILQFVLAHVLRMWVV